MKRDEHLCVCLSKDEKRWLREVVKARGLTISGFVRQAIRCGKRILDNAPDSLLLTESDFLALEKIDRYHRFVCYMFWERSSTSDVPFDERLIAAVEDRLRNFPGDAKLVPLLRMKFGLGDNPTMTLEGMARSLGFSSRERVRIFLNRALRFLRHPHYSKRLLTAIRELKREQPSEREG